MHRLSQILIEYEWVLFFNSQSRGPRALLPLKLLRMDLCNTGRYFCGYGLCGWKILRLVSDPFFFFPRSLVIFFLLIEAAREFRAEKEKTEKPLDSNFLFGV